MVPINFWQNSDQFEKKRIFFSSKFDKLRGFQRKSLKFSKENLSNPKHESLKCFWSKMWVSNPKKIWTLLALKLPFFYFHIHMLQSLVSHVPLYPLLPHPLPMIQPLNKEIFVLFMRVRQFISLFFYLICVYLCVNTLLSEISPPLSEISPYYQNSAPRGKNVLDQKTVKKTEKCYAQL